MIQVTDLHKTFGKLDVLKGVSFSIDRPGVFAILGHNGSGKTTMLKTILGMVIPNSGELKVNDQTIYKSWEYRKDIAYLPQIARFPENLTVNELIKMILDIRNRKGREEELIQRFGLEKFLDKKLSDLSGGTRQKVNIVLAFMFDANICIMDEPTAGLDPVAMIELKKLIDEERKRGKTILITTHIMSLVEEVAEEIIFLLDGKIHFQGTLGEMQKQTNEKDLEHAIAAMLVHDSTHN
ncbi:ABC transporter ATP-binding protein [Ekhidna sp.]|jgi:Cu-processing system ATP-binding protein|uniref:ABC transporter ATP-binding protein n=1 Tax=Ekhidna sp. TaxID=2608089 RepID=UPI0032F076DA